jgi:hypothetical protein
MQRRTLDRWSRAVSVLSRGRLGAAPRVHVGGEPLPHGRVVQPLLRGSHEHRLHRGERLHRRMPRQRSVSMSGAVERFVLVVLRLRGTDGVCGHMQTQRVLGRVRGFRDGRAGPIRTASVRVWLPPRHDGAAECGGGVLLLPLRDVGFTPAGPSGSDRAVLVFEPPLAASLREPGHLRRELCERPGGRDSRPHRRI